MKYATLILCILLILSSKAQYVGINESTPGAQLTVRSGIDRKILLLKNELGDTSYYVWNSNHYMGGYAPFASTLFLNNRHGLPFDIPQLTIFGAGELGGGSTNGSGSTIEFRNAHSNGRFEAHAYLGSAFPHYFGIRYIPSLGGTYYYPFYLSANGRAGFGTYEPLGKLQVDHRGSPTSPALTLMDSATNGTSIIQFRNFTSTNYWQIRGTPHITTSSPSNELEFATQAGVQMSLTGSGNLDVAGNAKITGELHRTSTGTTNLVPIAFGNISASGGINTGSGNFTVSRFSTGIYLITITGESYQFQQYATMVTPVGSSNPVFATTGSGAGQLQVYTWNASGTAADATFHFVVYKQ